MSLAIDPFAPAPPATAVRFLYRLNPLSKLAAVIPATIALVFVRDLATPIAFLVLSYVTLLIGVRMSARLSGVLLGAIPGGILLIGCGFSLWVDASRVADTSAVLRLGDWTLYAGALSLGFATALRLGAIIALALVAGMSTAGPDLARSLVQQLRVPYRVGYTALAAFRFVPRFAYELEVIRQAHRVRGAHAGRTPWAAAARGFGYVVPLLAGAIRHAERVAMAMDARAFGAYPTRTERHLVPFRARDVVFIVLAWAASAAVFALTAPGNAPL
ncbi:energy-coupling factor transporter transmembrane protein EcfT [Microbacterium sp. SORGH_AS_0888]|uniref:energy-coupling factor transporter transmembrane component T family protein n=1 Tax=Microbacterium sp. SORGH_AS_0888 TaxID=3041791 RepID=UPI0027852F71|nr:energy-coupling factor transporter transmembrane component T [Microbacterium sp. SORGH_AS_0888]MDQ1130154.1 energy-coupling factor transport system permease protein [Microbacterium sp. SORGH_AS_0888]